MESRPIDMDAVRRVREIFHPTHSGDRFGLETVQDVEPVLDFAQQVRERQEGRRWGDGKHVATIPDIIVQRMMRDPRLFPDDELAGILGPGYKVLDSKRWKAWLNDSANSLFRTFEGRI